MQGAGSEPRFGSLPIASGTPREGCVMTHFVLAICCPAVLALALGPAHAQTPPDVASITYAERPPPPTEPSVVIAVKPAATKPEVVPSKPAAPKRPVRHEMARRRWHSKGPTGPVTMPPPDALVMMVRGTLAGVNQANFTENYAVLYDMTTPALQDRVSKSRFRAAFARLRQQNLDLSPVLVLSPQFTAEPLLTRQGVLKLTGFFPSRPLQIGFTIDYRPIDGVWLIDALSVSALPASAPAPMADAATPASPASRQRAQAPRRSDLFETRWALASPSHFSHATHFGPGLSFAAYPR